MPFNSAQRCRSCSTSPCFGFRQNVPLLVKERDSRERSQLPLLCEGEGCLRSRQGEVALLVEPAVSCPPVLTSPCFGYRQNVPLLVKERDVAERQGEVAIPSPCEGEGCLRSRQGEVSLLVEPVVSCPPILTSPCFGFRQNVPLLVKERDNRVRSPFPLLCEGEGCLRSRQGEVAILVEPAVSRPPT